MIRSLLKYLVFILCFTVEVQIHASSLIRSPEACHGNNGSPCVIKNISSQVHEINWKETKIRLAKGSIVRIKNHQLKLLKGEFLVSCPKQCEFSTVVVEELTIYKGLAYVKTHLKSTLGLSLQGHLSQWTKKYGHFDLLPGVMQEISLASVKSEGVSVPQMVDVLFVKDTLERLSESPEYHLAKVVKEMPVTVEKISQELKYSVDRKVASEKRQRLLNEERRKNYEKESRRLRRLFRKKNFL